MIHLMKRLLFVALGVAGITLPVLGQHTPASFENKSTLALYRPEVFNTVDGSVLLHRLPVHSFLDGTRFPVSSEIGQMGAAPVDLPSLNYSGAYQTQYISIAHHGDAKDFTKDGKDNSSTLSEVNPMRFGGEVGIAYGQWSGKYGGDVLSTYMQGSVGNDKFQINAGGSYSEWNSHYSRGHR